MWRMVGGHPRSLEYLDALLSAGQGRYPDITSRLRRSLDHRMGARAAGEYLASPQGLDAAMAEVAVLAADEVLLDDLLATLDAQAEALLLGLAVYREPVDDAAVAFAVGEADDGAGHVPDREGAWERILAILAEAGIDTGAPLDASTLPLEVLAALAPHMAEMARLPTPARRLTAGLEQAVAPCVATTLLGVEIDDDGARSFFVHRWSASELERRWAAAGRAGNLAQAHRRAAEYWRWRVEVWPQGRAADVHDRLEARHHLLAAGEVTEAGTVTEAACAVLHALGAWDREAALVQDTLRRLPESSERRSAWIHQLGILAQERGDYAEAEARYRQSLEIEERLGNQTGMASSYHQLGTLAQDRGDYAEAEARYRQSLEIKERLGDWAGMARTTSQMGVLLGAQGRPTDAVPWHVRALAIRLRLGVPQVRIDVRALTKLRGELGLEQFVAAIGDRLDEASRTNLFAILDEAEADDGGEASG